ncbi:hypothetical protein OSB04_un000252 [Centaurea solstitialis]|uniref:Reverse transcriptase zinc-binding domain-containing protein n=1 Tax=Centaurea solstitialis TaxID=347529 RepID=A0AA38SCZ8_9ASTR|nr:hypothetical protein OSB04_un000252 [Centaurea solstitialis]
MTSTLFSHPLFKTQVLTKEAKGLRMLDFRSLWGTEFGGYHPRKNTRQLALSVTWHLGLKLWVLHIRRNLFYGETCLDLVEGYIGRKRSRRAWYRQPQILKYSFALQVVWSSLYTGSIVELNEILYFQKKEFGALLLQLASNLNLELLFQQEDNEQRGWKWLLDPSYSYSVASLRKALDKKMLQNSRSLKTTRIKVVPNKVNVMVWKDQHRRLATFSSLAKRGVIPESRSCPLCSRDEETEDHLFANCQVTRSLLTKIDWGLTANMKGDKLQIFLAIIYTFFWQVWRTRNEC